MLLNLFQASITSQPPPRPKKNNKNNKIALTWHRLDEQVNLQLALYANPLHSRTLVIKHLNRIIIYFENMMYEKMSFYLLYYNKQIYTK